MESCSKTKDGSCFIAPFRQFSSELKDVSSAADKSLWEKDIVSGIQTVVASERVNASACNLDETARAQACSGCKLAVK